MFPQHALRAVVRSFIAGAPARRAASIQRRALLAEQHHLQARLMFSREANVFLRTSFASAEPLETRRLFGYYSADNPDEAPPPLAPCDECDCNCETVAPAADPNDGGAEPARAKSPLGISTDSPSSIPQT
jgi:hypothetical protein